MQLTAATVYSSPGSSISNASSSKRNANVSSVKPLLRCRPSGPRAIAGLLSLPNRRWKNQTYFILKIVASLAVRLAKNYSPCWRCSLANTSWALLLLLPPIPASASFFIEIATVCDFFQLCGSIQASLTFGLTRLQAF